MQQTNENKEVARQADKGRQLTWADIPQEDIPRFRLERAGRSYAANYSYDPIIDVYRSIYNAYCKGHDSRQMAPMARSASEWDFYFCPDGTEDVETGVFQSDLDEAVKEIERRRQEENDRYAARASVTSVQEKNRTPVPSDNTTATTSTFKFSFASLG